MHHSPRTLARRALAAVLAVVALAGGLSACGDPQPIFAPPTTPSSSASTSGPSSPTSTASAGPQVPVMPAMAKKHTTGGAKAFVRYYWKVADYATQTGDTALLKTLDNGHCAGCNGATSAVDAIYSAGNSIASGESQVLTLFARPVRLNGGASAYEVVTKVRTPTERVLSEGRVVKNYSAGTTGYQFTLTFSDIWTTAKLAVI